MLLRQLITSVAAPRVLVGAAAPCKTVRLFAAAAAPSSPPSASSSSSSSASERKRAVIVGGSGALGAEVVKALRSSGWWVCNVDLVSNKEADDGVLLDVKRSPRENAEKAKKIVGSIVPGGPQGSQVEAVICTAGGWVGEDFRSPELFDHLDKMWRVNLIPAVTAAHLAAHFVAPKGFVILTGAHAALLGTPSMVSYGISKSATHHLVASLAAAQPEQTVLAILPRTLDTPSNRAAMPDAPHGDWTPLPVVADRILAWLEGRERAPRSGALVSIQTQAGSTRFVPYGPSYVQEDA